MNIYAHSLSIWATAELVWSKNSQTNLMHWMRYLFWFHSFPQTKILYVKLSINIKALWSIMAYFISNITIIYNYVYFPTISMLKIFAHEIKSEQISSIFQHIFSNLVLRSCHFGIISIFPGISSYSYIFTRMSVSLSAYIITLALMYIILTIFCTIKLLNTYILWFHYG